MFCVILLFSGLLFGTTSAQYGGYPNIGGSSPFLSSSIGSAGAYSSYSPYNAGQFVKGGAHIVPMPYPYPYSYRSQGVRSQPIVVTTGRRSGGFLGGAGDGGLIGLLIPLVILMALFPMLFAATNNANVNNAAQAGGLLGLIGKK